MSAEKTDMKGLEGEKTAQYETVSQYNPTEAYEEAFRTMAIVAEYLELSPPLVMSVFKEFLHWLYAKAGTHQKPSDMIYDVIKERLMEARASSDATPTTPKGGTND